MKCVLGLFIASVCISNASQPLKIACEDQKRCENQPCFLDEVCLSAEEKKQIVRVHLSCTTRDGCQVATALDIIVMVFENIMCLHPETFSPTLEGATDWVTTMENESPSSTSADEPETVATLFAEAGQTTRESGSPNERSPTASTVVGITDGGTGAEAAVSDGTNAASTSAVESLGSSRMTEALTEGASDSDPSGTTSHTPIREEPTAAKLVTSRITTVSTGREDGTERTNEKNCTLEYITAKKKGSGSVEETDTRATAVNGEESIDQTAATGTTASELTETTTEPITGTTPAGAEPKTNEPLVGIKLFFVIEGERVHPASGGVVLLEQQTVLRFVALRAGRDLRFSAVKEERLSLSEMDRKLKIEAAKRIPCASLWIIFKSNGSDQSDAGVAVAGVNNGNSGLLVAAVVCIGVTSMTALSAVIFRILRRRNATRHWSITDPEVYEMVRSPRSFDTERCAGQ